MPGTDRHSRRRPPGFILAGSRLLRRFLIFLVKGYQAALSPWLGGQCRFLPSCSDYALIALRTKPAWKALLLIAWRIMRCQPFCKCGYDPVPECKSDEDYSVR